MTIFAQDGSVYSIVNMIGTLNILPIGTYLVKQSMSGYYLDKIDDFSIDHKIYGESTRYAERILTTFNNRPKQTGVLLAGEKGSGKTLLTKQIAIEGAKHGVLTLVVNQPHSGDGFNQFLSRIEQPCIVIFDEFEKVYPEVVQNEILTLLDGVFTSKKLFLLTVNDIGKVNEYMKNRPGRLFYNIKFAGLSPLFVKEYCEDNLRNKDNINGVVQLAHIAWKFSFDMLKAIVEEMNRYNENVRDALQILNVDIGASARFALDGKLYFKGIEVEKSMLRNEFVFNPLIADKVAVQFCPGYDSKWIKDEKKIEILTNMGFNMAGCARDEKGIIDISDLDYQHEEFTRADLKKIDIETGTYTYEKGDYRLALTKKETVSYDYRDCLF